MAAGESMSSKEVLFVQYQSDSNESSSSTSSKHKKDDDVDEESTEIKLPDFNFEKSKRAGLPLITGYTENETKARKLNKTEETRLETLQSHFEKQKTMYEKQYNQHERRFRIRSARVIPDSNFGFSDVVRRNMVSNARPKSLPAHLPSRDVDPRKSVFSTQSTVQERCKSEKMCDTCVRMQKVIKQYEKEMKINFDVETTHRTVCLFTDKQMKNFIRLVETKYCADLPGVAEMLHNTRLEHGHSNGSIQSKSGIQARIREFCKKQDEFNKEHPVSKAVKSYVDQERIKQAKLSTRPGYIYSKKS